MVSILHSPRRLVSSVKRSDSREDSAPAECKSPASVDPYQYNRFGNRYVYATISRRARGISIGIDLSPDRECNFDCLYCNIDRTGDFPKTKLDIEAMALELEKMLEIVTSGSIRNYPEYANLPDELIELKQVCLSGQGEPTLNPDFAKVVETVVHVRARGRFPFFKLVLVTNATKLTQPLVLDALNQFTPADEVWAKLETGTPEHEARINRPRDASSGVFENILHLARQRPVVIQSLFSAVNERDPSDWEIEAYVDRLRDLVAGGAQISRVQIYSASLQPTQPGCSHLSVRTLSSIARRVREVTGLRAEVF